MDAKKRGRTHQRGSRSRKSGNSGKTGYLFHKINLYFTDRKKRFRQATRSPLTATSHTKPDDRCQHAHRVSKEVNLASRNIKPVNWKFDDSRSRFCQSNEKLHIEGKSLLVKTTLDGLIAFASHEFEAALGIINGNACRNAHKRREETTAKMPEPGSLHGAAEDLAAGTKQSIWRILPIEDAQNPNHLVRRNRAVGILQAEPLRLGIQIPAGINCSALPFISGAMMEADVRAAALDALTHFARFGFTRSIINDRNAP
jgi:hypothetical protein